MKRATTIPSPVDAESFPRQPSRPTPAPRLRRGTTLIELMIAMLILAIVCISWLQIIGIQSARREARRREAVERLVGMMDAFMYLKKPLSGIDSGGYEMVRNGGEISFERRDSNGMYVYPVFDPDTSPIGYQLLVKELYPPYDNFWFGKNVNDWLGFVDGSKTPTKNSSCFWLFGVLYDQHGNKADIHKQPFFTLPVCLGL